MKLPFGNYVVFLLVCNNQEMTILAAVVDPDLQAAAVY
jgi:hypothetical protein